MQSQANVFVIADFEAKTGFPSQRGPRYLAGPQMTGGGKLPFRLDSSAFDSGS